ncbi:F-box/kelch-repeat protein At1g57790-like [Arachis ipaensis]|uniref:F-box/kelch-repeat protein At1g57790-like n=1 Tax=Arachis ipaensis TaxID=130454 RepID=UPI0007AF67FC|nr:F-box/kelch-repeat protein At1g57790-like [Arachis ipaensis]XP_025636559.1 F-box/kelch-repeat protein At1g57790-like [Arachis hypogaea]
MGWMDLPVELLELIFQRLCLDDAMNCRAACRSWRKAVDAIFSSQLPLMLSLSKRCENNYGSLSAPWSNHDSTVLTQTWPQGIKAEDVDRVHSVQGWLMFNIFHYVSDKDQTFSELSFFNPFSRARFKLPKLFLFSGKPSYYQVRVAFNSAPPGSEEFVVAFLSAEIFYDIEVHGDNKLYGLTVKHNTSVVFVFTLDNYRDDHVVERLVMLNTIEGIVPGTFVVDFELFKRSHQMVMDTSTGELLLVRHLGSRCFYDLSVRTKGFSVFKLDRSNLKWCEIFDIGDRFLFWDFTKVSLVSAKGLRLAEEFKRGNCIFFCHVNTRCQQPPYRFSDGFKEHDMGVFFLADRTISHFPISSSLSISRRNMWFSPAP